MRHIRNYDINYQAYQLMQVLGNGVTSLDTMISMLGLGVHSGSHREWTYIGHELGKSQQKMADKIQENNLQIEIAAMLAMEAARAKKKEQQQNDVTHTLLHCDMVAMPTSSNDITSLTIAAAALPNDTTSLTIAAATLPTVMNILP